MDYITFILTHKGKDKALEEANKVLKTIKKAYSERSYYRLKKRLKEDLDFEI